MKNRDMSRFREILLQEVRARNSAVVAMLIPPTESRRSFWLRCNARWVGVSRTAFVAVIWLNDLLDDFENVAGRVAVESGLPDVMMPVMAHRLFTQSMMICRKRGSPACPRVTFSDSV
jgi:hypothetical protein